MHARGASFPGVVVVHGHPAGRVKLNDVVQGGFAEIGFAPRYLPIAGRWQDHVLHQRLADDPEPRSAG